LIECGDGRSFDTVETDLEASVKAVLGRKALDERRAVFLDGGAFDVRTPWRQACRCGWESSMEEDVRG
jgi:hypothetical protein